MTGYGRGEASHGGLKFTVELNSVNRKQADITVDLPREIIELEPRIRDLINAVISRGRLNVVVAWHRANGNKASDVRLDEDLAKSYMRGMQKLKRELKLNGAVSLDTLLRCPGILKMAESEIDPESVRAHVEKALNQALAGLLKMREKEGRHLKQDLLERLELLEGNVKKIKSLAPAMVERYREQLHERIKRSGLDISIKIYIYIRQIIERSRFFCGSVGHHRGAHAARESFTPIP
jgi:uncharacterized protein (TIGR00255 family)